MKTFLACYGAVHFIFIGLGMMGVVDYHLCIKGPGECCIEAKLKEKNG